MHVKQIHHATIICSDYEVSKHFYVHILGFSIIAENYREERGSYKLDLLAGESQLELFSFPSPPERPDAPEARGLRHLAFAVEDVQHSKQELEEKGVSVEEVRIDPYTGRRFTFFKDPDQLPLELYETREVGVGR
ncbi:VOC family protein [Halobacillus kuroshimensis]|uniref:VOC family protein n=1 Tax=Halobacillus kuroshimensis TaxID=302481 RepID=A0ABS3E0M7_9BACI|nr:VOC family protein [Halobacillus kuroshimensis]MBN8237149.1 VOC family protein [Halobacillus kuroshimensis]